MRDFWGFFNQKFSSIKDLGAIGYADIIGLAITSLFWLYLSNLMDVDEYGKLHYFISIASIAYLISLIGSPYVITVYTAKKIKIQSTLFLISILIGAISAACVFIFTNKLEISILIIAYIINEVAINYLLGKKLFVNYSKYIVIQKTLLVTLGFGFFYFFGLDGIIYGFALSYFHLMIIIIKIYRESKVDIRKLKDHRGFIIDNYIMSLSNSFRQHLDKIIIADILPVEYKNSYDNIFQSLKSINPRALTKRIEFEEHLKNYFDDELFISFLSKNLTRDENGKFKFKFNLVTLSEKFDQVLKALKPSRIIDKEINLIYGTKSDYITESKLNDSLQYFSNIKLSVIENAGHWLHYEKQDEFINHCKKIISI